MNLIPVAGGFLATYFGEIRGKRIEQRMVEYFRYFKQRLDDLDQSKVDYGYLQSEEFAELFLLGAEQAARSTTQKRIRRFANILINNALRDASTRARTQNIIGLVDRISDSDAFILLSFGHPDRPSLLASTKEEVYDFVKHLASYLGVDPPREEEIFEAILYLDNLGLTWVTQTGTPDVAKSAPTLKDFSCFRSPLGTLVTSVIAPPGFFLPLPTDGLEAEWPEDCVSRELSGEAIT